MKKKLLFVALTAIGTLHTSCIGSAIIWLFAGAGGIYAA